MKKIALVFNDRENQDVISYVEKSLYEIFQNTISIRIYYFDELKESQIITADAYILNGEALLYPMTNHLNDLNNLIVLNRSINKKYLPEILQISRNNDVLVVNDSLITTMETLNMLYKLGISHLHLIPYNPHMPNLSVYDHINYAITPNELSLVPEHIKNVINIGYREISGDTLLALVNSLEIDDETIRKNIIKYIYSIVEPNIDLHANYLESFIKSKLVDQLITDSSLSIFAVGADNKIVFANKQAEKIFNMTKMPARINDLVDVETYSVFNGQDQENHLISLNKTNYIMQKTSISLDGWKMGYIISLQSEKHLRDTEIIFNKRLKEKGLLAKHYFSDIIYCSDIMSQCITLAQKSSKSDYTVLLYGESGTGKELFAQSIHNQSMRKDRPFIAVNCAALPETLLESELFGYEAGAFTGARDKGKLGLFEQANTGTIFLDEIGDISSNMQSRLLRVIQEKQIMRIGSDKIVDIDVRIIVATNKHLLDLVNKGLFREDLYYRLNVIPISIPPLRHRKEDITPLLKNFLGSDYGKITTGNLDVINNYDWPGNIRELENAAIYYKIFGTFPMIKSVSYHSYQPLEIRIQNVILKFLLDNKNRGISTGRIEILQAMRNQGLLISDVQLRKTLSSLQDKHYILIGRGRQGTTITDLGIQSISE